MNTLKVFFYWKKNIEYFHKYCHNAYSPVSRRSSRPEVFRKTGVLRNFAEISEACNFIKKETLAQVFSCEFCEISKNSFFHGRPLVAASIVVPNLYLSEKYEIVLEKCHIFYISVAPNINFYKVKSSRDTKICRKVKFQGFYTELRRKFFFFSGNPLQNTLRLINEFG